MVAHVKTKMKVNIILTSIFAFVLLLIGLFAYGYVFHVTTTTNELVTAYEQELRVQHEYQKACEAHRMYLTHVLDNHNINYVQ